MTTAPHRDEWVLADAFDRAAPTYDAMVALSPGYHDQLRTAADALVERLASTRTGAPAGAPAGSAHGASADTAAADCTSSGHSLLSPRLLGRGADEQPDSNDAGGPDEGQAYREPIKVLLGNGRSADR